MDDGSCENLIVNGCTDSGFVEYSPFANIDDGSTPVVFGCTDDSYFEFSISANTDDGSCETLIIIGCFDPEACNHDFTANTAGPCTYAVDIYGVEHVDCAGNCLNDIDGDGICDEVEVPGCTDDAGINYNPSARIPMAPASTAVVSTRTSSNTMPMRTSMMDPV